MTSELEPVTAGLIARARAGDGDAFRDLTEPHRRELLVHCYRMLGSFQDAEDVLQDTLLAAWQGLGGFEGRASVRTWLYRIATNRCLNARRSASRRPAREWDVPGVQPPEPTRLGEIVWLEPYPDALLEGATGAPPGRPLRAGRHAGLDRRIGDQRPQTGPRQPATPISAGRRTRTTSRRRLEDALVARFTSAWESADVAALVAILTDDVFISMPPMPFEYEGADTVARFCANLFGSGRRYDLVPTRANGQPAFGAYLRAPTGIRHGTGLYVLTLTGDRICAMARFDNSALPWFGLPRSLPSR